jgi:Cys-tRNA(Pro) deacylase
MHMAEDLSSSVQQIQQAIKAFGLDCQVVEMEATTRSAQDAARAIGCRVEQIVKSLVFKGKKTQKPVLILASGANRVNIKNLREHVAEAVKMADPDFVQTATGFAIGGVPPIGHVQKLKTFIDKDLMQHGQIWAAAGTSNAMFEITPQDLQKITGGQVISIT